MRTIHRIVVHCADTPSEMDIGVDEIRRWHLARGWDDVGYHYVIRRDGTCEDGRPVDIPGAHAVGYNFESIGICLVGGGGGKFNYTKNQLDALSTLVYKLLDKTGTQAKVCGHNDLTQAKTCPNFDVKAWWYGNGAASS